MAGQAEDPQPSILDVRGLPASRQRALVLDRFDALGVGDSFRLRSDDDLLPVREVLDRDQPGSFSWEEERTDGERRVRLTRLATTALPRILVDAAGLAPPPDFPGGAAWSIDVQPRDLDSNLVVLPPGGTIGAHTGPEHDVLVIVLDGSGALTTERGEVALRPGQVALLPRLSLRAFTAGPAGLRHLTVHRRRPTLQITHAPR